MTPSGEDVSIGATWRSTMMANSARDPYWQAGVRRETIDHPTHVGGDSGRVRRLPHADGAADRARRRRQGRGVRAPADCRHQTARHSQRLAADGVSCTVCHQIAPDELGTRESFNANFVDAARRRADGTRAIFGPYRIDAGRQTIMRSVTGFVQAEAPHIKQSELCASCHTLITEASARTARSSARCPSR